MPWKHEPLIEFTRSEEFLRKWYPRDLLMPVQIGSKHPLMPHSKNRWSWSKLDEWKELTHNERHDACVVLSELCVIDVDNEEIAARLESSFPVLHSVPMEKTTHGRHYWFRRSDEADIYGYYDGHGQREKGVDFKSRCRTGTGGIVVIAPSSGKTWANGRELNADALVPIPLDLLDAVALPLHRTGRHLLRFSDSEDPVEMNTISLSKMSYFEPFLQEEDFIGCGDPIPVPCTRQEYELLMRVLLTSNERWKPAHSPEEWSTIIVLADKLGLDPQIDLYSMIANSTTLWSHDLQRRWPEMARAIDLEHAYRRGHGADDSICIDISEMRLVYEPIKKETESWGNDDVSLFGKGGPRSRHVGRITRVLDRCGIPELPEIIALLIKEFPLVLAGGSVLGMVAADRLIEKGHDFDLFAYGLEDDADCMMAKISGEILTNPAWRLSKTNNAWTFVEQERRDAAPDWQPMVVQVILRIYRNPYEVPVNFDIAASRVAIWSDADGKLIIRACPSWIETMRRLTILVEPFEGLFSKATTMRFVKYAGKGFDVMMPGLRKVFASQKGSLEERRNMRGVRCLVYVDQMLDGRWPNKDIRKDELPRILRLIRRKMIASDYAVEEIKLTERFWYAVRTLSWICKRKLKRFFEQMKEEETATDSLILWRKYGDRQPSQFTPESPCLRNLHLENKRKFDIASCESLGIKPCATVTLAERIDVALQQEVHAASPQNSSLINALLIADIYSHVVLDESNPDQTLSMVREVYRRVHQEMEEREEPSFCRDYIKNLVRRAFLEYRRSM